MNHHSFALLFVFCLLSCQPPDPTPNPVSLAELHERIETELPVFTAILSGLRDTIIRTPNDVLIQIPADAFVDAQGNAAEGEVELALQEVFSTAQTILQPISTTTVSGELIASRGMIKIEAFKDGQALEIGQGKSIDFGFPGEEEDYVGYDLFYGVEADDGTIAWEVDTGANSFFSSVDLWDDWFYPIRFWLLAGNETNKILEANVIFDYYASINNYTQFSEKEMIRYTQKNVEVRFRFFEDGTFGPHTVLGDLGLKEKKRLLGKFEKLSPLKIKGRDEDVQGAFFFDYPSAEELKWRKLKASLNKRFLLSINRLGWTNCDIFLRLNLPVIDMEVERPTDSTLVKLIFIDYKTTVTPTLLENGNLKFYGVPEGATANIVAITPVQDDLEVSITSEIIQPYVKKLASFEKVTEEELVQRLNALN